MNQARPALLALTALCGCYGSIASLGPGDADDLEHRSLAVDPRTEAVFTLQVDPGPTEEETIKILYHVDPQTLTAAALADLSGRDAIRLLFPAEGVMLVSWDGAQDEILRFDSQSLAEVDRLETGARYGGLRLSPSGTRALTADTLAAPFSLHFIDTQTLETRIIPREEALVEAQWLQGQDRLVLAEFRDPSLSPGMASQVPLEITLSPAPAGEADEQTAAGEEGHSSADDAAPASLHIELWASEAELAASAAESGAPSPWDAPLISLDLPDARYSYGGLTLSADDRYAALPTSRLILADDGRIEERSQLLILDLETGDLRAVDYASGPVAFTPDSSTIVSYHSKQGLSSEGGSHTYPYLLLIDALTLETELVHLPTDSAPIYFVTREGNAVVIDTPSADVPLMLFDLSQGQAAQLIGPDVDLGRFVSREGHDELWLLDRGLFRLDYGQGVLEEAELDFRPANINILPQRDEIVVDDPAGRHLAFIDPDTGAVRGLATLPE